MDKNEFCGIFKSILNENGLERFEPFSDLFYKLTDKLLSSPVNVTAIRSVPDIISLHYADSLLGERFVPRGARCVDVGAGGGFPSLPLAAVRNDIRMTALDSTGKKLDFIKDTAAYCGVGNIETLHARAEEAFARGAEYRETFDCATARAVAPLDILSELCLPAVRQGGVFLAYRGADGPVELEKARKAIAVLGGAVDEVFETDLVSGGEKYKRYLIVVKKTARTDGAYPRKYSKISKQPLG